MQSSRAELEFEWTGSWAASSAVQNLPQKSNFVVGFPFHKAEQYYTQLKTAHRISVGMAGKPKENAAEYQLGNAQNDSEIL